MTTLFAPTALLPDGWADNVLIEIDRDGAAAEGTRTPTSAAPRPA